MTATLSFLAEVRVAATYCQQQKNSKPKATTARLVESNWSRCPAYLESAGSRIPAAERRLNGLP